MILDLHNKNSSELEQTSWIPRGVNSAEVWFQTLAYTLEARSSMLPWFGFGKLMVVELHNALSSFDKMIKIESNQLSWVLPSLLS